MFRYKIGSRILIRRYDWDTDKAIEVEILDKAPRRIKAKVLSDGWFRVGGIYWLYDSHWFSVGRITLRGVDDG